MIKRHFVPSFGCVAGITLFPITAAVDILDLMAAYTFTRRVFVFLVDMAGSAVGFFMRAFEREIRFLVMIKFRQLPAGCRVAVTAFFSIFSIVNVRFFMAGITILWCFGVFLVFFVAGRTARFDVHAFEQEIGFGMVESRRVQ